MMAKRKMAQYILWAQKENVGVSKAMFDSMMGWKGSATSSYTTDRSVPSPERVKQVEKITGVTFQDWCEGNFVDIEQDKAAKLVNGKLFGNRPDKTYLVLEGVEVQAQNPYQAIENIKDVTMPTVQIVIENGQIVLETPIE